MFNLAGSESGEKSRATKFFAYSCLLYSIIENLEEENKTLKSEISSMKNQNPHEETMEMNIPNDEIKEGLNRYKSFPEEGKSNKNMHTIHENYKNYQCESCSESFSQAAYLEKHIYTIHESHRDHKCEYCGKSFSQSQNVKKHKAICENPPLKSQVEGVHQRKRNHKCEQCDKIFTLKRNLCAHIKATYEDRKTYNKCENCGKLFTALQALKIHLHTVHDGHQHMDIKIRITNVKLVVNHFLYQVI